MVRALASHARGPRFKSLIAHHASRNSILPSFAFQDRTIGLTSVFKKWPGSGGAGFPACAIWAVSNINPIADTFAIKSFTLRLAKALCYSWRAGKESIVATALRFLQIFSLGAWVGSIVYFIVFTAGIFPVVNNNDLAGMLVGYALGRLHVMGIIAGVVYLLATVAAEKSLAALVRPAALLVFLMIVCTMASQYGVIARMDALKLQMGSVDATPGGQSPAHGVQSIAPIFGADRERGPAFGTCRAGVHRAPEIKFRSIKLYRFWMLKPFWRDARICNPRERENKYGNFGVLEQSGSGNREVRSVEAPVLPGMVGRGTDSRKT